MKNKAIDLINQYIKGTYEADITLLKSVFHSNAVVAGYFDQTMIVGTPQDFFNDISSKPSMASQNDPYKTEIVSVNISGKIGDAVLRETGFRGTLNLENRFHLIEENGAWKIISKTFTTF